MKKKKKIEWEITKNKKAFFDYEIIKSYEWGIDLKWHETKSMALTYKFKMKFFNYKWSMTLYKKYAYNCLESPSK